MKKILSISVYALFLTGLLSTTSCKKEDTDATETFSYTETIHDACISDWWTGSHTENFENDITTATVQQAFASQGRTYTASKIVSAKLTSLKVTAGNGTSNLDNIESIEVTVKLAGATTDVEVAHAHSISSGAQSVFLTVTDVQLKTFLTQLSVLTVKITTKNGINPDCVEFSQGVVQVEVQK